MLNDLVIRYLLHVSFILKIHGGDIESPSHSASLMADRCGLGQFGAARFGAGAIRRQDYSAPEFSRGSCEVCIQELQRTVILVGRKRPTNLSLITTAGVAMQSLSQANNSGADLGGAECSQPPIGDLSEEAQEVRHREYHRYRRIHSTRKNLRGNSNFDLPRSRRWRNTVFPSRSENIVMKRKLRSRSRANQRHLLFG